MAVDNDIDTVLDERGDTLEALFWGSVFLFTLAMFFWEFGLGAIEAGEGVLQPIGTITEFAQTMWLSGFDRWWWRGHPHRLRRVRYSRAFMSARSTHPGQGSFKPAVFLLAVLAVVSTTIFVGAGTLAQTDEASPADAAERLGVDREVEMGACSWPVVLAVRRRWRSADAGRTGRPARRHHHPVQDHIGGRDTQLRHQRAGITKDAMPGQVNQAWFYVGEIEGETQLSFTTQNGQTQTVAADTYQVRCAELCGKGHSKMIATVYIINPDDYERWVEAQGGNPDNAFSTPDQGIQIGNATAPADGGHDEGGGQ